MFYSFQGGADGPDGESPSGGLIFKDGNFYGVTSVGGTGGGGIVFKVDAATGAESVLHNFTNIPDGGVPVGGLVYKYGSLFGTTAVGGAMEQGTIYSIDLSTSVETVLYSFIDGATVGRAPNSTLTYKSGAFYGTTHAGGTNCVQHACGTIFKFVP